MSEATVRDVFDGEEVREVLRDAFYQPATDDHEVEPSARRRRRAKAPRARAAKPKPTHYDVICISLYQEDLSRLDAKVRELKAKGHRKMSRSALIRYALDTCDLEKLPRPY